jgi:hypothetical protein
VWSLRYRNEGTCRSQRTRQSPPTNAWDGLACVGFECDSLDEDTAPTVELVNSETVGPYETVVLEASSADDLITWLQDNAFLVPDDAAERMRPYVDAGSHFVALRLASDQDAGDIVPLSFRYRSDTAAIPLQLTGVAADPDMRLHVWVLGEHRAVPESYLHVGVNPFAIAWQTGGANYDSVISRAADEAGGQGFATDAAIPSEELERLWVPVDPEGLVDGVRTVSAQEALRRAVALGVPVDEDTAAVIGRHVAFPVAAAEAGFDDLGWFSCVSQSACANAWPELLAELPDVDTAALAADLETDWLDVLERNQELLDRHGVVTRLRSSMGPEEMSADPTFVLNPDLALVDRVRRATLVRDCGTRRYLHRDAPRWLELEDGRRARVPPGTGTTGLLELEAAVAPWAAEVVERTGRTGQPVVLTSNTDAIAAALEELEVAQGCGCTTRTGGGWWILPALLVGLRRRRDGR